jgi:endonuclease YncB( thermonuclease family)
MCALGVLSCCGTPVYGEDFDGFIIGVLEGDTLQVMKDAEVRVIRLDGVDAPEIGQPYDKDAHAFTVSLALGKKVHVMTKAAHMSGIQAAVISLPSGLNLSHELLKAGLAWWDRIHVPLNDSLWKLEREARTLRRGLWDEADPIPPWEWRKGF